MTSEGSSARSQRLPQEMHHEHQAGQGEGIAAAASRCPARARNADDAAAGVVHGWLYRQRPARGKVALVTGGDSGIGRAVAIAFAKEGADVAIAFLEECEDARQTRHAIEKAGRQGLSLQVDLVSEEGCRRAVDDGLGSWAAWISS